MFNIKTKLMKLLFPALLAAFSIPLNAQTYPGFSELDPNDAGSVIYFKARDLAVQLALKSTRSFDGDNGYGERLALQVADNLRTVAFFIADTPESSAQCAGDRGFFVSSLYPKIIHVCDNSRDYVKTHKNAAIEELAQLLLHEAVHLAGIYDECIATKFELIVMNTTIGVRTWANNDRDIAKCQAAWE